MVELAVTMALGLFIVAAVLLVLAFQQLKSINMRLLDMHLKEQEAWFKRDQEWADRFQSEDWQQLQHWKLSREAMQREAPQGQTDPYESVLSSVGRQI